MWNISHLQVGEQRAVVCRAVVCSAVVCSAVCLLFCVVQFAFCFEVCLKSSCEKYKWNTLAVSEWIFVKSNTGDFTKIHQPYSHLDKIRQNLQSRCFSVEQHFIEERLLENLQTVLGPRTSYFPTKISFYFVKSRQPTKHQLYRRSKKQMFNKLYSLLQMKVELSK
jgi:hypothetical protein